MGDWVVGEGLDCVIVTVLEDALQLTGPYNDTLVCSPAGESLAVPGVVDTIYRVLVSLKGLDERPICSVIHQHSLPCCNNYLGSVGPMIVSFNSNKSII